MWVSSIEIFHIPWRILYFLLHTILSLQGKSVLFVFLLTDSPEVSLTQNFSLAQNQSYHVQVSIAVNTEARSQIACNNFIHCF